MTLERAAEMVSKLRPDLSATQLFDHFVEFFKLDGRQQLVFAQLCGFVVLLDAQKSD